MSSGFSRRRWLLGLLTALGSSWLAQLWPAASPSAAPGASWLALAGPRLPGCDSLGHAATYVDDGTTCLVLRPIPATGCVTTVVCDGGREGGPSAG